MLANVAGAARVRAPAASTARPTRWRAAIADARARTSRMAKVAAGEAAALAARTALQVHGAIGYTGSTTSTSGCGAPGRSTLAWGARRLHRARVAASCSRRARAIGPGTTF